jgi:hypothetical protein
LKHLEIAIPDFNAYYTLYAEGSLSWKTYDRQKKNSLLYYPSGAVVFLFYTYPTHRTACVIRNAENQNGIFLPGLSKKVLQLFSVTASRVDKLKRAMNWLNKHSPGAFVHDDGFYTRLVYILEQRGKINYAALSKLAESSKANSQINLF